LSSAVLCLLAGCDPQQPRRRAGNAERLPRAEVVQPSIVETLARRIDLAATVEPMEKVDLCARVPGVVAFLPEYVDIGYRAKAGEKLVALDVPDLLAQKEQKVALLELAENQLEQIRKVRVVLEKEVEEAQKQEGRYRAEFAGRQDEHARIQKLVERNAQAPEVAREKLALKDTAEATWQAAQAQIGTKRAKLEAVDIDEKVAASKVKVARADVRSLEVLIDYATLKAPFAGTITKRWVDRGATLKDASVPLLTLMRVDTVRVLLDVPDRDAPLIRSSEQSPDAEGKGSRVALRFPSLLAKGTQGEFPDEQIKRTAQVRDGATRTMRAEVHLDNRSGLVQPNTFGSAVILLEKREHVVTIPASALIRQGDYFKVLCLADVRGSPPRGVVREAEVRVGLDDGRQVEVLGGLETDTWVIARSNGVLRPGDEVIGVPLRRP
jgi:RND family efflux transporter MFP subunit